MGWLTRGYEGPRLVGSGGGAIKIPIPLDAIACPLLVVQGANDPRVVAAESEDVVARLKADGKDVAFLLFEDEGHDVLKLGNRVRCYDAIAEFYEAKLGG